MSGENLSIKTKVTRLALRYLTENDLAFADSLRAIAGWNQTLTDWHRIINLSPRGCLVAECEGQPVGTATTICYGKELGWIGMMLVHPDFRRRGIARVLLEHCIEILRSAGVKAIKLDATPDGREVYSKIGFQEEYTLTRYQSDGAVGENPACVRTAQPGDLAKMAALDRAATGGSRENLLERLIADSLKAVVYCAENEVMGFGILRAGAVANYIGPVVATDSNQAQAIASSLLGGKIFCDLPDHNESAARWAKDHGFSAQRTLTRMYLRENVPGRASQTYFAIASPDLG
jgi:GNAT superfamily N-acetyltransferase